MANVNTSQVNLQSPQAGKFTLNLAQVAAAYLAATATGGDILVLTVAPVVTTSVTGLTTTSIETTDTTSIVLLAATAAATMTAGKNLTAYTTPFVLRSTKTITFTNIGNGSAGALTLAVQWLPLSAGATLA